ncbi:hypothetical protein EmuJ_000285000 [Echinococcus multilocularis]|uniref:Uncharacterized protein n=1 Tax=Echinococcus multilocularis TaxID=6211 RepID=A0A068Y011_ECHMU|nr:hypothetical protein EmuJ_000285000 [Echinococcus multilocularis]
MPISCRASIFIAASSVAPGNGDSNGYDGEGEREEKWEEECPIKCAKQWEQLSELYELNSYFTSPPSEGFNHRHCSTWSEATTRQEAGLVTLIGNSRLLAVYQCSGVSDQFLHPINATHYTYCAAVHKSSTSTSPRLSL